MTDFEPNADRHAVDSGDAEAIAQLSSGRGALLAAARTAAERVLDRAGPSWHARRDPSALRHDLNRAAELYALLLLRLAHREERREVTYSFDSATVHAVVHRDPKTVTVQTVARAILVSWAARSFDNASAIGSLPTQLYRPPDGPTPDDASMFFAFALASLARGNHRAYVRAATNLREAAPTAPDPTTVNGFMLPMLAALDAIEARKPRIAERQLNRVLRYHQWRHRDDDPQAAIAVPVIALRHWAERNGVTVNLDDPRAPLLT